MTRLDILKRVYEMATHNLYCYSANLLMTEAKKGKEKEWADCNEEVELLAIWIAEMEGN